jgi:hypothetical protein
MNDTKQGTSIFWSLLQVAFITLKLTGYINWSWWWVLSPIWGGLILTVLILGIAYLVFINSK